MEEIPKNIKSLTTSQKKTFFRWKKLEKEKVFEILKENELEGEDLKVSKDRDNIGLISALYSILEFEKKNKIKTSFLKQRLSFEKETSFARVQFYSNGRIIKIKVNGDLPINKKGKCILFSSVIGENENGDEEINMLLLFLEKAFNTLNNCVYPINATDFKLSLSCLTNWIPHIINISSKSFDFNTQWNRLKYGINNGLAMIQLATNDQIEEEKTMLKKKCLYPILEFRDVETLNGDRKRYLLLKNPFCEEKSWKEGNQSNGLFWINYKDVVANFQYVCEFWNPKMFNFQNNILFFKKTITKTEKEFVLLKIFLPNKESVDKKCWILLESIISPENHHSSRFCSFRKNGNALSSLTTIKRGEKNIKDGSFTFKIYFQGLKNENSIQTRKIEFFVRIFSNVQIKATIIDQEEENASESDQKLEPQTQKLDSKEEKSRNDIKINFESIQKVSKIIETPISYQFHSLEFENSVVSDPEKEIDLEMIKKYQTKEDEMIKEETNRQEFNMNFISQAKLGGGMVCAGIESFQDKIPLKICIQPSNLSDKEKNIDDLVTTNSTTVKIEEEEQQTKDTIQSTSQEEIDWGKDIKTPIPIQKHQEVIQREKQEFKSLHLLEKKNEKEIDHTDSELIQEKKFDNLFLFSPLHLKKMKEIEKIAINPESELNESKDQENTKKGKMLENGISHTHQFIDIVVQTQKQEEKPKKMIEKPEKEVKIEENTFHIITSSPGGSIKEEKTIKNVITSDEQQQNNLQKTQEKEIMKQRKMATQAEGKKWVNKLINQVKKEEKKHELSDSISSLQSITDEVTYEEEGEIENEETKISFIADEEPDEITEQLEDIECERKEEYGYLMEHEDAESETSSSSECDFDNERKAEVNQGMKDLLSSINDINIDEIVQINEMGLVEGDKDDVIFDNLEKEINDLGTIFKKPEEPLPKTQLTLSKMKDRSIDTIEKSLSSIKKLEHKKVDRFVLSEFLQDNKRVSFTSICGLEIAFSKKSDIEKPIADLTIPLEEEGYILKKGKQRRKRKSGYKSRKKRKEKLFQKTNKTLFMGEKDYFDSFFDAKSNLNSQTGYKPKKSDFKVPKYKKIVFKGIKSKFSTGTSSSTGKIRKKVHLRVLKEKGSKTGLLSTNNTKIRPRTAPKHARIGKPRKLFEGMENFGISPAPKSSIKKKVVSYRNIKSFKDLENVNLSRMKLNIKKINETKRAEKEKEKNQEVLSPMEFLFSINKINQEKINERTERDNFKNNNFLQIQNHSQGKERNQRKSFSKTPKSRRYEEEYDDFGNKITYENDFTKLETLERIYGKKQRFVGNLPSVSKSAKKSARGRKNHLPKTPLRFPF